jgi:hypothetical protein
MVFPISARTALDARLLSEPVPESFARFEGALHQVLIQRKADILLERSWTITRSATDLLELRLHSERQAMQMAGDRLEQAITAFRTAAAVIQERLDQSGLLLKHQVERIHAVELKKAADAARGRLFAKLWPQIDATLRSGPGPVHRQVTELSERIGNSVVEDLRHYYRDSEELVYGSLSHALTEHMARVQIAVGEVVEQANQLLAMRADVPRAVAPISEHPRFYFRDWDSSGGLLLGHDWALRLPRRWAEPRARERLRELLQRRIHQNLEAIRYDWVTRLDDAVRRFQASSREQLAAIVGVIADALDRAERLGAGEMSSGRLTELDQELATITALRMSLGGGSANEMPQATGDPPGRTRGQ